MKKVLKNKKAFTLTEMIVVIAIIGILAGVLIPTITGYIKRANQSAAYQEAEAVLNVYEVYETEFEAGLTTKSFKDYYLEVSDGDTVKGEMYFEFVDKDSDTTYDLGEETVFIYVADNGVVVEIELENNTVSYDDKFTKTDEYQVVLA